MRGENMAIDPRSRMVVQFSSSNHVLLAVERRVCENHGPTLQRRVVTCMAVRTSCLTTLNFEALTTSRAMSSRTEVTLSHSAQRQCLCIVEIQTHMLRLLARGDCARVAQVSTTFYEQAMDILWADVETFVPFIKCMPSGKALELQIKEERNRFGEVFPLVSIAFSREPQSDDWRLFCKHNHRVRVFVDSVETEKRRFIGRTAYQFTREALKTTPLLHSPI
ncbi:hypothetical protein BDY19DRAFT_463075 [Irpex rosettiformis]|uniref:Uncharacterized protein n=1 Tax=Irpex rosettiformis TaxID=378272 RepID=A0ACB8TSM9_9APHY|nr:hypothetical protein BDY19DRAFT_463075 [Irpex rosettiformis]